MNENYKTLGTLSRERGISVSTLKARARSLNLDKVGGRYLITPPIEDLLFDESLHVRGRSILLKRMEDKYLTMSEDTIVDELQDIFLEKLQKSPAKDFFLSNNFFRTSLNSSNEYFIWKIYQFNVASEFKFYQTIYETRNVADFYRQEKSEKEIKDCFQSSISSAIANLWHVTLYNLLSNEKISETKNINFSKEKQNFNIINLTDRPNLFLNTKVNCEDKISPNPIGLFVDELNNIFSDPHSPKVLILPQEIYFKYKIFLDIFYNIDFQLVLSKKNIFLEFHNFDDFSDTAIFYKRDNVIGNIPQVLDFKIDIITNEKTSEPIFNYSFFLGYTPLSILKIKI